MLKATQVFAALMLVCALGSAQATPHGTAGAKHSSVTHSSSFGSFNSSSAKTGAGSTSSSGNSFGTFGSSGKAANVNNNTSSSALSKNLEQQQAQKNALNNFDASHPQRPNSSASASGAMGAAGTTTPFGAAQPSVINQTVIVHDRGSSGWGSGWMWFWLGQASEHHSNNTVYVNNSNPAQNQIGAIDDSTSVTTTNGPATAQQSGTSWLVIVIWVVIGAGVTGLIVSHWRQTRQAARPRNYTL